MSVSLRHTWSRYASRCAGRCARHCAQRGFTLVEALAATVLLALLAAAIAGLSVGWMHAQQAVSHAADHNAPARRALAAIADDLRAAAPGSVSIETADMSVLRCITAHPIPNSSTTPADSALTHGWHRVRWFIDQETETLVREAQPIDQATGTNQPHRRVVLLGAAGLLVGLDSDEETTAPNNATPRPHTVMLDLTLTSGLDDTYHAKVMVHASSLASPQSQEPRRVGSR